MGAASSPSRIIGILLLAQMLGGVLVNFVLAAPLFGEPGFLVNAAPHAPQISLSVLLGLATSALSLGIAILAFPIFRQYSQAMALWFVALATVSLAVSAVEHISVMSMLSLSEAYAKASGAEREAFELLRVVVGSARNWAHYIGLVIVGAAFVVFYAVLYRFALVPRVLAAFGLAAVMLQIVAVAMPLFGQKIIFLLLAPLAVSQLALMLWLIIKGFRGDAPVSLAR